MISSGLISSPMLDGNATIISNVEVGKCSRSILIVGVMMLAASLGGVGRPSRLVQQLWTR